MTGSSYDPGIEEILVGLTRAVVRLPAGKALMIAEFAVSGVIVWKVRSGSSGVPHVRSWRREWYSLRRGGVIDQRELRDHIQPKDGDRLLLGLTDGGHDAERAFDLARAAYSQAGAFRSAVGVDELLKEATARVPLPPSVWYELVLLRRSRSGRLELTAQQLFLPGASRGDTRSFTVRCEASDENGTVFAVAARDASSAFELVSMASVRVPPGTYDLTATLRRPGRVRFDGLPVKLREDSRNWQDVLATVPGRLDRIGSAHLIVAVEVCGSAEELRTRADLAGDLISYIRNGTDGPVAFSLVTYASHSHDRQIDDEPVTAVAWAETDAGRLDRRLNRLRARRPAVFRYPRAAQVECMLAEVARRLRVAEATAGRPALVTIGDRPPFPPRIDPPSGIIPCPRRIDWRAYFLGLVRDHSGMAFGVIRDITDDDDDDDTSGNPADDIWRRLGTDASAALTAFDAHSFAVDLGLLNATMQYLPLPLTVSEGS